MSRRRVYLSVAFFLVFVVGVWFLFIREFDVRFKFKARTLPDIALVTFKTWASSQGTDDVSYDFETISAIQTIKSGTEKYTINWSFDLQKDSTTIAYAAITSDGNRFKNRLGSLFSSTPIKKEGAALVNDFYNKLNEHLAKVRVKVVGKSAFDEQLCICLPVETTQLGKAGGMMKNYSYIGEIISKDELKINGNPLLEIEEWDQKEDFLKFNFCFPVEEKKDLSDSSFFYKSFEQIDALQAVYNGNYINSDRAWYALKFHAERNDIQVEMKPLEIFYHNPNIDREEMKWRADVFLPLSK